MKLVILTLSAAKRKDLLFHRAPLKTLCHPESAAAHEGPASSLAVLKGHRFSRAPTASKRNELY